jgi:hypothetical protein
MFRCRSFPGQCLFLTCEQGEDRLNQLVANHGIRNSPVVIDRGYFGAVRPRSAAGRNAGTASPIPRR